MRLISLFTAIIAIIAISVITTKTFALETDRGRDAKCRSIFSGRLASLSINTERDIHWASDHDVLLPLNSWIAPPATISSLSDSLGNILVFRVVAPPFGRRPNPEGLSEYKRKFFNYESWSLSPFISRQWMRGYKNRYILIALQNVHRDHLELAVPRAQGTTILSPETISNGLGSANEVRVLLTERNVIATMKDDEFRNLTEKMAGPNEQLSIDKLIAEFLKLSSNNP